jgi:hypothetical protein
MPRYAYPRTPEEIERIGYDFERGPLNEDTNPVFLVAHVVATALNGAYGDRFASHYRRIWETRCVLLVGFSSLIASVAIDLQGLAMTSHQRIKKKLT